MAVSSCHKVTLLLVSTSPREIFLLFFITNSCTVCHGSVINFSFGSLEVDRLL